MYLEAGGLCGARHGERATGGDVARGEKRLCAQKARGGTRANISDSETERTDEREHSEGCERDGRESAMTIDDAVL